MNYKDIDNIELDDVHFWDHPKYCDAYISYAEINGVPLTDEQLDELNEDSDFVYHAIENRL